MRSLNSNSDRGEDPAHRIVRGLFAEEVIDNGPGSDWPAVIELPDQSSSTMAVLTPLAPPASVAEHQSFSLRKLCKMDEGLFDVSRGAGRIDSVIAYQ